MCKGIYLFTWFQNYVLKRHWIVFDPLSKMCLKKIVLIFGLSILFH